MLKWSRSKVKKGRLPLFSEIVKAKDIKFGTMASCNMTLYMSNIDLDQRSRSLGQGQRSKQQNCHISLTISVIFVVKRIVTFYNLLNKSVVIILTTCLHKVWNTIARECYGLCPCFSKFNCLFV